MASADSLHGLLRLPGATYACVVERDSGRVLAEAGNGEGGAGDGEGVVPYSVARWGTAVAAMFDATSGDELDDVMITGRRSYHLVRSLGASASVLAYLRLDRARSNLAVARRELAAVRWGAAAATRAAVPAVPALPAVPLSRPTAAASRPGEPAARDSPGSRGGPDARAAAETRAARGAGARSGSSRGGAARTVTRMPASLPPGTPARGLRPVDGPAGGARGAARPQRDVKRDADPADAPRIPLPRRAPADRSVDAPPRRGTGGPAEASAVPEGFALPAVLGQSWAQDPGTLRRLIAGLRRMS